ncbi:MAG: hypothetical protein ACKO6N_14520 [Myxococcota bacterium]
MTLMLVGVVLVLLVLGIRYLLQRRKAAAGAPNAAPGEASAAAPASRIDARDLSSMDRARQTFLEGLSLASRLRFRFYRPFVVLGDSADGKTAVISHYLDWQGQAARFNPPYTDHPLVQFYLGSSVVVYELSAVMLQEHSKEVARSLDRFFREVFRIHPPEVVIALRLDEHMDQQLPRLIPLAQALRGRLDTLSRDNRKSVRVRLALTHLDQVEGFLSLRRFLDAAQLPMSIPLSPLMRPEGVQHCLDSYNDYLNQALRDGTPQEFEAILTCLELLPERLGWLPAFLQELARPELASQPPVLEHLYLCAVGAASTPETAVSSQGFEIGNPFRAASMLDVAEALSRSNRRHRNIAASIFAVGATVLTLVSGFKAQRLNHAQELLDGIDGAELGMSREVFSQLVERPAEEVARDGFGLARNSDQIGSVGEEESRSNQLEQSSLLAATQQTQARERLKGCATGKKGASGVVPPPRAGELPASEEVPPGLEPSEGLQGAGQGAGLPPDVEGEGPPGAEGGPPPRRGPRPYGQPPDVAAPYGMGGRSEQEAEEAQAKRFMTGQALRDACRVETEQGLRRPLFVRQGAQEAQLLEVGRVLRALDTMDNLLWVPSFFHVELKAEAIYRFKRAIRQQFLLKGLREGADEGTLGRIYYALGLLYLRRDTEAENDARPFGFDLDPQHFADALSMPRDLAEDYSVFTQRPWQCPLDVRYWKVIDKAVSTVEAQELALEAKRTLSSMSETDGGTSATTSATREGQRRTSSGAKATRARTRAGSSGAGSGRTLRTTDADGTGAEPQEELIGHGLHDFSTLQGWSAFLNDLRQLWRKGTPRQVHFQQAQQESQEALAALIRLRQYDLQGEIYPYLPHEVRFCMPPPEQSMAELEKWTYQQQKPLRSLLSLINNTSLLPEYQRGMTLMELRRVLIVPQALPNDAVSRIELQLEGQQLVFEAARWKTFATRVRNLSLVERFMTDRALEEDNFLFFTRQAKYPPEQLWLCEASQTTTAPGCADFPRCELPGFYTSAAYFDAMRSLELFDPWLEALLLERPTKERFRSLVQSDARLYIGRYQQALFCYYQDFQVGSMGLSEQLAELSRPASSLTSMLEDVARHADSTLPAPEWEAFVESVQKEARESGQANASTSAEVAGQAGAASAGASGVSKLPVPPGAPASAAAGTASADSTAASGSSGSSGSSGASGSERMASPQDDERLIYLRPLEVFQPVLDVMAGEKGEHPRMAAFHRLMGSLASELAQEDVQRQSWNMPPVPLDDLAVGLDQYVSVSARYALKDLRGEVVEPRTTLQAWLQELRLDQDARLSLPFRRPVDALLEHGRRSLAQYLSTIWQQGLWPQLRERSRYRPFAPYSTVMLEPDELSPWLSPAGTFWEQVERLLSPVLLKRPDGTYVPRVWSSRERLLPDCMLERLNHLTRARAMLWDEKGTARELPVQVQALPLPERVEELAPISVTLRVGASSVLSFNQRPVDSTLMVPWEEPYSVSLEVRALKLTMVDDRNRRSNVKTLNDAPEVFGALVVPPSPWALQELLAQGTSEEGHLYTWTVWVGRKPVPVTFRVRPDPYASLVRAVQKECGDAL